MRKESGFTLGELMTVIAIIGIMAAIAIPNFMSMLPRNRLNSAVRGLYGDLQAAKLRAIRERLRCDVTFDEMGNTYTIFLQDGGPTPLKTVDLADYGSGVQFDRPDAGGAAPAAPGITFNSQGLGTSGYAYLTNSTNTGYTRVGSLSSGVIRISDWQGGTWQ